MHLYRSIAGSRPSFRNQEKLYKNLRQNRSLVGSQVHTTCSTKFRSQDAGRCLDLLVKTIFRDLILKGDGAMEARPPRLLFLGRWRNLNKNWWMRSIYYLLIKVV